MHYRLSLWEGGCRRIPGTESLLHGELAFGPALGQTPTPHPDRYRPDAESVAGKGLGRRWGARNPFLKSVADAAVPTG